MVLSNARRSTIKQALTTCCTVAIIFAITTSVSDGLKSPQRVVSRHTRLNLVDPDAANILTTSALPFLQAIHLPDIPAIDPQTGALSFLNPLLTSGVSSLGWFAIFDAARFPFLPRETTDFLLTLPVIARMVLGFLALDVLPTVVDIILLRTIWLKFIAPKTPYKEINIDSLPQQYDVDKIAAFYKSHPRLVLARATDIVLLAKDFLFGLLSDYRKGVLKTNQPERAVQFTELIFTLGPTFIKVGQALSIRPDLASPAYLEELVKLQDQVPPFSSVEALKIIGGDRIVLS